MNHPVNGLDDTVHQRARLGILAVLAEVKRADLNHLKEVLELTDGNLSRHLRTLEEAGYVEITKAFEERRPRTWLALTRVGRQALRAEISALRALIGRVDNSSRATAPTPSPAGAQAPSAVITRTNDERAHGDRRYGVEALGEHLAVVSGAARGRSGSIWR